MQQVGHDLAGQRAVGLQELRPDVLEKHRLAVVEFRDGRVDLGDLQADGMIRLLETRENGEQQDLRLGRAGLDFLHDRRDALGDLRSRVGTGVVGADHQHDRLGLDAVEVAVLHAPEDMLRAVAADAEVGGLQRRVAFGPDGFARAAPALGDGIAKENDIDVTLLGARVETLVLDHPVVARHRRGGGIRRLGKNRQGTEQTKKQESRRSGKGFHGKRNQTEFRTEVTIQKSLRRDVGNCFNAASTSHSILGHADLPQTPLHFYPHL